MKTPIAHINTPLELPDSHKVSVRRGAQPIGSLTVEEIKLCLTREDGGLLLTDEIFVPARNEWIRISEILTQRKKDDSFGLFVVGFIVLVMIYAIFRKIYGESLF